MKKIWIVALVVVMVAVAVLMMGKKPDLSQYKVLDNPQISMKPAQKMLVVQVKGVNTVMKGYSALFKTFFGLKSNGKRIKIDGELVKKMGAPRGRYLLPANIPNDQWANTPKDQWICIVAVPVPDIIDNPLQQAGKDGIEVKLEDWKYGEVAEILHYGPYAGESLTIEKLHNFIKEKGYVIAGPHEEEYLIGPGGPGLFVKPKDYVTIIRYEVKKK